MRIAFYAPFKPLDHQNPSGDLIIARGLTGFLTGQGHKVAVQSRLRARWIYFKPRLWFQALAEIIRIIPGLKRHRPDVWLTYHSYYKAPDILGPLICRLLSIRYLIFQGIYSTKPRRRFKTIFGFYLNRLALKQADHVFTNKRADLKNLKRIIPRERLTYIRPVLPPLPHGGTTRQFKIEWNLSDTPVILTAAMFRDDVKTQGLAWLITCLSRVAAQGIDFHLVIAGSGKTKNRLKALAARQLPGCHTFAGKIAREDMAEFYGSGDIFAFPGIRESLGMVFLEAQSCGLPVVAFDNGGIPEVVQQKETGILLPMYDEKGFSQTIISLLEDPDRRRQMGECARNYVNREHDLSQNYRAVETILTREKSQ